MKMVKKREAALENEAGGEKKKYFFLFFFTWPDVFLYRRIFADVIVYIFAHLHTTYLIEAVAVYMS